MLYMEDDTNRFIEWCAANGWQHVVQKDLDRRNAAAHGASVFSQARIIFHKRQHYREVYLKSDHWKNLRERKLQETPYCERCDRSGIKLDVHHKVYRQLYDVTLCDLISLCRRCHSILHWFIAAEKETEWDIRIIYAALALACGALQLEHTLEAMGVKRFDLDTLNDKETFKFGVFKEAFSSRPIGPLRKAYSSLSKRAFFPLLAEEQRKAAVELIAEINNDETRKSANLNKVICQY